MRQIINWLMTMLKPKQCQNCGENKFCITETIKYIAHLDRKSKQIVTDSVMESNIDKAFCINCGAVQERADFATSTLTD